MAIFIPLREITALFKLDLPPPSQHPSDSIASFYHNRTTQRLVRRSSWLWSVRRYVCATCTLLFSYVHIFHNEMMRIPRSSSSSTVAWHPGASGPPELILFYIFCISSSTRPAPFVAWVSPPSSSHNSVGQWRYGDDGRRNPTGFSERAIFPTGCWFS